MANTTSPHWEKLGRLYCPAETGRHPKLLTHAANPLPLWLEGDTYRIFYCGRDAANRSSVGAVDIDIVERRIVREHAEPAFEFGPAGSFYADGVSIGDCYTAQGVRYMLFMGWQSPAEGHFRGDVGRLIVGADWTLRLDSDVPLLAADPTDPISISYPCVSEAGDGQYLMWYGSTVTWDAGNREMLHPIHSATSADGHHWTREGLAVPYELGRAQAFSRPTVARGPNGTYQMWFSYRGAPGSTYRIGHAVSPDGRDWRLALDAVGIDVSPSGWDSDMISYPYVFDHGDQRYMLYTGNGYGRTGFGLAVLTGDRGD
jgi:hypothetical protein